MAVDVGAKAPDFTLHNQNHEPVTLSDVLKKGPVVLAFLPGAFSGTCTAEMCNFRDSTGELDKLNAQVLGVSVDSEFVHHAWRTHHPDLKNLPFPMLADIKRELSSAMGVLHKDAGVPLRATFIADPEGIIRHVAVNDLNAGRNVAETVRMLDALQTDELCPCNWEKGQETLTQKMAKAG